MNDLLIAEVGIKDYGDFDNQEIANKFKVKKEDFPVLKLFIKGKEEPVDFGNNNYDADTIKKFIRSNSNVYLGLPGCLESFDGIALNVGVVTWIEFQYNLIFFLFYQFASADAAARKSLLREAEDLWDKASGASEQKAAEMYVKTMRKIIDKGNEFVQTEMKRIQNIVQGKISAEKIQEMNFRLNILQSFRDEL